MLSEIRRKKLTHLFNVRDTNQDGYLEKGDYERIAVRLKEMFEWDDDSEIYQLMRRAQVFEWEEIRKLADADHDDKVTLQEFFRAYTAPTSAEAIQVVIDDMLNFTLGWFDDDRDGYVQAEEYVELMSIFNVTDEAAREAFRLLDRNKRGKLSGQNLRSHMVEFFLSDDTAATGTHFWGKVE